MAFFLFSLKKICKQRQKHFTIAKYSKQTKDKDFFLLTSEYQFMQSKLLQLITNKSELLKKLAKKNNHEKSAYF